MKQQNRFQIPKKQKNIKNVAKPLPNVLVQLVKILKNAVKVLKRKLRDKNVIFNNTFNFWMKIWTKVEDLWSIKKVFNNKPNKWLAKKK